MQFADHIRVNCIGTVKNRAELLRRTNTLAYTPAVFSPNNYSNCLGDNSDCTQLNSAGSALTYATLLGGSGSEDCRAIAVDAAGSVYVTGETDSLDFPATAGALDTSLSGPTDAFVVNLTLLDSLV